MTGAKRRRTDRGWRCLLAAAAALPLFAAPPAQADEGGLSFWLPGLFGSLAAAPTTPGLSFTNLYYHTSVDASGGKQFPRGGRVEAGVRARGNIFVFGPTYTFEQPFLGAQASVSLFGIGGRNGVGIDATLTGPRGNTISGEARDGLTALGDLLPQVTLKWNFGVHNVMAYATGDIPVGSYDPSRLANLGINHAAYDAGGGYTYFNPETGREFSAVLGFTFNSWNPDTNYRNGIDAHLDLAASQFITKNIQIGVVGYYFQQLTADSGAGATLGAFRSRVAGVGPQVGFVIPVTDGIQAYLNLKGYYEFAAENRPNGWNAWVTLAFSPAPPKPSSPVSLTR